MEKIKNIIRESLALKIMLIRGREISHIITSDEALQQSVDLIKAHEKEMEDINESILHPTP